MSTKNVPDPKGLLTPDLPDALLPGVEFSIGPCWDTTHLHAVSKPWRDLGIVVIPSDGPISKEPLEGQGRKCWSGEGRVLVPG